MLTLEKAEQAFDACKELIPLLDQAGVLNLYIAPAGSHHRTLCSPEQIRISDLLERLIDLTKEAP